MDLVRFNESIGDQEPMPKIDLDLCKGCGICIDACPNNAITLENKKATINDDLCLGCEVCIGSCPNGAITSERFKERHARSWPHPHPRYKLYYHPSHYWTYSPRFQRRRRGGR